MRFKTIIELRAEAKNKSEALEIVEEYLSGNITTGVYMRCITKPVCSAAKVACIAVLSIVAIGTVLLVSSVKHPQVSIRTLSGISAVQPPLNTSVSANHSAEFKKEWEERHTREALDLIRR
ncbi:MAG: hypothetical protein JXB40_04175 [Candidatus Omnitrophica bacterium]|nr:hypothetical protein [Candidatus Omnitrophota bacterium]